MLTVNAEVVSRARARFAQHVGAGSRKRIQLLLAQAGFHTAQDLVVPDGLTLGCVPSHRPEWQPAERFWLLVDEALANRHFATLDALADSLRARCLSLVGHPDLVRTHTCCP